MTLDTFPKNVVFDQYDADTELFTPNFIPGKYAVNSGKSECMGYIFDECIKSSDIPYYEFVLINNGKIVAFGDEQGRCGGILSDCKDENFLERLQKSIIYDKVKHLPIAEELEEPIYKYFDSYEDLQNYKNNSEKN